MHLLTVSQGSSKSRVGEAMMQNLLFQSYNGKAFLFTIKEEL
jgi:hypothetical protein